MRSGQSCSWFGGCSGVGCRCGCVVVVDDDVGVLLCGCSGGGCRCGCVVVMFVVDDDVLWLLWLLLLVCVCLL